MKNSNKNQSIPDEGKFALPQKNVYFLIAGLAAIALGFVLMVGGGSDNPDVFREDALFSFRRMVLAPIIVCAGFAFEIIAIMRKNK